MDTGVYLSAPLGGRPGRFGRSLPSFAAIADRAADTSSAVTRRACSKGNSPRFFIAPSLPPARRPSADEPVGASGLPDSEDHDQDSTVSGSDQPTSLLAHRMNERRKSKGVVESSNRLLE